MKILLIGEYYSYNMGDPLLCRTVEKLIKAEYPQADVIPFDMSGQTGFGSSFDLRQRTFGERCLSKALDTLSVLFPRRPFFNKYATYRTRHLSMLFSLFHTLRENHFDLAVFAGGSLFMDYFSSIIYMIMNILSWKKIPVIFHACGTGTMDDNSIRLLDQALQKDNIRSISLRDSYELFNRQFHTQCPVTKTFDTALNCSRLYPKAEVLNAQYGICVIHRPEYFEAQKNFIQHLINHGKSFKLYTNGLPKDYEIAEKILSELGISPDHYAQYLLPKAQDEQELIQQVTSFNHIYAYRMHSLIIASSFGINHFGFVGEAKIPMFYRHLNAEDRCAALDANSDFDAILDISNYPITNLGSLAASQADHSFACLIDSISQCIK